MVVSEHIIFYILPYIHTQIRRGNRDNLAIIFLILTIEAQVVTPSLELSYQDGSNEGSQHMFSLKTKKNNL